MVDVLPAGEAREVSGGILVGWAVPRADHSLDIAGPPLGEIDSRRAIGLGTERRAAFLTGRALLALLLRTRFGAATAATIDTGPCPRCSGEHGPAIVRGEPAQASVSYADGLVVAAVGDVARLGVDVESVGEGRGETQRPGRRAEDLGRLLGVAPDDALQRWTQVEAVLKAAGCGLRVDPGEVRFDGSAAWLADDPTRYRVRTVEGPAGYLISSAWSSRGS